MGQNPGPLKCVLQRSSICQNYLIATTGNHPVVIREISFNQFGGKRIGPNRRPQMTISDNQRDRCLPRHPATVKATERPYEAQ